MIKKTNEINTSYDQDQLIGDTPSNYPAGGGEPIDAKTGQDFLDINLGEEGINDIIGDLFSGDWIYTNEEKEILKKMTSVETIDEETRRKIKSDIERSESPETYEDLDRWAMRIGVDPEDYHKVFEEGGYMYEDEFAMYGDESLDTEKYFDHHEYDPIMEDGFGYQEQEGTGGYFTCKKCGDLIHYDGWASDVNDLLDEHLETHGITEALNKDGTGVKRATRGVNPTAVKNRMLSFIYVSKSDCPTCKQYDGKVFAVDDPDRPIIPRLESQGKKGSRPYTHPHCKCKWVSTFSDPDMKNFDQINEVNQKTINATKEWVEGQGVNFNNMTKTQQYVAMIQWMQSKDDAEEFNELIDPVPIASMVKMGIDAIYPSLKNRFGKEFNDKHDNDGRFAKKNGSDNGWNGEPTQNKNEVSRKLARKYPNLNTGFIRQQVDKADKIRAGMVKVNKSIQDDLKKIPNMEITGRIKKADSMVGKIGRKPNEYKDVSDLYDVSGARAMAKDLKGVQRTMDYIRNNYNIIKEKDNISQDRGGYRSYHAIVEVDGIKTEIQVRTENQDTWAVWAHDLYKPPTNELEQFVNANRETLNTYSSAMSQYFYELDMGRMAKKPECPPEIVEKVGCLA